MAEPNGKYPPVPPPPPVTGYRPTPPPVAAPPVSAPPVTQRPVVRPIYPAQPSPYQSSLSEPQSQLVQPQTQSVQPQTFQAPAAPSQNTRPQQPSTQSTSIRSNASASSAQVTASQARQQTGMATATLGGSQLAGTVIVQQSAQSAIGERQELADSRAARRRTKAGFFRTAGARLAERLKQARRMPAWMISFIFHLLLLIILALIPIPGMGGSAITLFFGGDTNGISDFELGGGDQSQIDSDPLQALEASQSQVDLASVLVPVTPVAVDPANAKLTGINNLIRAEAPNANFGEEIAKNLSNGLRGRQGANKGELLRRGGGSAETEDAVEMGLVWLAKQQRSDGSWSLTGPYANGGVHENTIAATGMALNAFLGAGYHQLEGKYAGNVQRGLNYLIRQQNSDGFFTTGKEQRDQRAYAQAIATISVCEAYGLSSEYKLIEPCQKAIKYAEWAQSRLKGWRYQPREDADVSVTGWFVMALETAKLVGFKVNDEKLDSVNSYLDSVGHRDNSAYAYDDINQPDLTMTAEGLLCRIWLGWTKTHPALLKGVEELVTHIPSERDPMQSVYYWYYATQVLHHFGGEPWDTWNARMKRALPAMQIKDGEEKGSWAPSRDVYGIAGGRLYTTALSIYCLEVYYRHLAIYDVD